MPRSLIVLAGLLAAALVWAFLLVHPPGGGPSDSSVRVWRAEPREVERLIYRDGATEVALESDWSTGGDAPLIWVRTVRPRPVRRPAPKPGESAGRPRAKAQAESQAQSPGKLESVFRGNAAAAELLRRFSTLDARRAIGNLEQLDGEAFGLPAPGRTLRLELRGGREPLELEIGGATYGKLMRYGQRPRSGSVYLFHEAPFGRLHRARATLFDRALFPFPVRTAARIRISSAGAAKELWRLGGGDPPRWGAGPDDGEGSQAFALFVNALTKLKAVLYLTQEGASGVSGVAPAMEIELFSEESSTPRAWLRIFPGEGGVTNARSSHTIRKVRVSNHLATRVLDQGAKLLKAP